MLLISVVNEDSGIIGNILEMTEKLSEFSIRVAVAMYEPNSEIDKKGKDTKYHQECGAKITIANTLNRKVSLTKREDKNTYIDDIDKLKENDLVFIIGYKDAPKDNSIFLQKNGNLCLKLNPSYSKVREIVGIKSITDTIHTIVSGEK